MYGYVQPAVIVVIVVAVFGSIGGIVAAKKDRSVPLWSILCGILPPLLVLLWFLGHPGEGKRSHRVH